MTEIGEEIYEELINISQQMKLLEEREKELKKTVLDNYTGEVKFGEWKIMRVTSNKTILKEWFTVMDVKHKFGEEYILMTPDIKALSANPEAHVMLDLKPSSYIKITKEKTKQEEIEEL